jgi:TPR repeat protein
MAAAALCLLASPALRAQPSEPPEFRATVEAYLRADYGTALPLLRIQAADGYAPSQYLLALLYLSGDGVPRNEPAAAFWLHKAVLKDHPLSQYELAVMLDEGLGIGTDHAVAKVLLDHAALRGVAVAERRVRIMSAPIGTDKEELEAADRLAALGDKSGAFLHRLRAARLGNAQAQYAVGLAYLFGEGTVRHPDKAVEWLRKVAAAGDVQAQSLLGMLLQTGQGVTHDLHEALEWYRAAAKQGDAAAAESAQVLSRTIDRTKP